MLWRLSKKFQFAADRIIPDSFVSCVILTLLAFIASLALTPSGPEKIVLGWYNGLWTMIAFAFQMSFMVVCCGAAAKALWWKNSCQGQRKSPKLRQLPWCFCWCLVLYPA